MKHIISYIFCIKTDRISESDLRQVLEFGLWDECTFWGQMKQRSHPWYSTLPMPHYSVLLGTAGTAVLLRRVCTFYMRTCHVPFRALDGWLTCPRTSSMSSFIVISQILFACTRIVTILSKITAFMNNWKSVWKDIMHAIHRILYHYRSRQAIHYEELSRCKK